MKIHEIPQDKLLAFITSGNAIFTIKSEVSGNHYTYSVRCSKNDDKDNPKILYVRLFMGADNVPKGTFLGYIKRNYSYSKINDSFIWEFNDRSIDVCKIPTVFKWIINMLNKQHTMIGAKFWHEGRCCRCGKLLTDEVSVEMGIGKKCSEIKIKARL